MKIQHIIPLSIAFVGTTYANTMMFDDVDTTHPYFIAIDYYTEKGVVEGYKEDDMTLLKPLKQVNRVEALKLITTVYPQNDYPTSTKTFTDIDTKAWYMPYLQESLGRNIVQGYADNTFKPEATVSRSELLKMLSVVMKADISTTDAVNWYDPYMQWGVKNKIIESTDTDYNEYLTRGKVLEMLYRSEFVDKNNEPYRYNGDGKMSYYSPKLAYNTMASGMKYDPESFIVAHRTLPFGTKLRLTRGDRMVIAEVQDRGPYSEKRVLDASEAVFRTLGELSEGVINVHYEVIDDDIDAVSYYVPEALIQEISPQAATTTMIPEVILAELSGQSDSNYKPFPYYNTPIKWYDVNYYDTFTMYKPLPQTIYTGTVLRLSGKNDDTTVQKATVFVENSITKTQKSYTVDTSDGAFYAIIPFLEQGSYTMGVVFDEHTRSKVAQISVINAPYERRFLEDSKSVLEEYSIDTNPTKEALEVHMKTSNTSKTYPLYRLRIVQMMPERREYTVSLESGITDIELPYSVFGMFSLDYPITITLLTADSLDGTMPSQTTKFKELDATTYRMARAFPDMTDDNFTVMSFTNILSEGGIMKLSASTTHDIPDYYYITMPSGNVETRALEKDGEGVYAELMMKDEGTYVIEIVSTSGQILFNRAVYVSHNRVLPSRLWATTAVPTELTMASVLHWTNTIRGSLGRDSVQRDADLEAVADDYLSTMIANNYIGHTSLDGKTLIHRVKAYGLEEGKYGENIARAGTIDAVLNGLETSGSHRMNLISKEWSRVGIATKALPDGTKWVVQVFGE